MTWLSLTTTTMMWSWMMLKLWCLKHLSNRSCTRNLHSISQQSMCTSEATDTCPCCERIHHSMSGTFHHQGTHKLCFRYRKGHTSHTTPWHHHFHSMTWLSWTKMTMWWSWMTMTQRQRHSSSQSCTRNPHSIFQQSMCTSTEIGTCPCCERTHHNTSGMSHHQGKHIQCFPHQKARISRKAPLHRRFRSPPNHKGRLSSTHRQDTHTQFHLRKT